MLKAYRYRIYPNELQVNQLYSFFGAARFIYNMGLEVKIRAWTSAKVNVSAFDLMKQAKQLKDNECPWLKEVPAQMLQSSLRNLDLAYSAFFRGSGFPKFKSRRSPQSAQFPQGVKISDDKIFIPKLKWVSMIQHRPLAEGNIKTVTVSKTPSGAYYASILVDNGIQPPVLKPVSEATAVGVDVGLKTFATLSDGQKLDNPKYLDKELKRLRVEQRTLARRYKKGVAIKDQSRGWHKQRLVVAKLQEHIANKRKDFLHKTSTAIVKQYDTICLEDLNVTGMMQNKKLSRHIADVSWYEFSRMLEYKADWNGKNIIYIGRFEPSSKICSNCGNHFKELKLSDRVWICQKCGNEHDRDENAAKNIKTFGLRNRPIVDNVNQ